MHSGQLAAHMVEPVAEALVDGGGDPSPGIRRLAPSVALTQLWGLGLPLSGPLLSLLKTRSLGWVNVLTKLF